MRFPLLKGGDFADRRRSADTHERRLILLDRCRPRWQKLVERSDHNPRVLLDLAVITVGAANDAAVDGRCSPSEFQEALLWLTEQLVATVAVWSETDRSQVLEMLAWRFELQEFERDVFEDVWSLPEAEFDG